MSLIEAKIVMTEAYESRFGIFNHMSEEAKQRPLASVAMFPSENTTDRGLFYDAAMEFSRNNYREIWGYTLSEFLSMPQWKVKMIRDITQEVLQSRVKAIDGLTNNQ